MQVKNLGERGGGKGDYVRSAFWALSLATLGVIWSAADVTRYYSADGPLPPLLLSLFFSPLSCFLFFSFFPHLVEN